MKPKVEKGILRTKVVEDPKTEEEPKQSRLAQYYREMLASIK